VVAVARTHGKTTTSSMLAWILEACGKRPGYHIGGVPMNFGASARLSSSQYFVIEADEYDTAFFDKRSKFIHYRPRTAVLNNLEFDHADIFADLAAIETQFHHLVRTIPRNGRVLVPRGDAALERVLARGCWAPRETFGPAGDWQAAPTAGGFDVLRGGAKTAEVKWTVPGEHNRMNALAALAAAHHAGVAIEDAARALASFQNVRRRLELRGEARGVRVFDDFAHHPTAIAATLQALLERTPGPRTGRVLAVLEPRSNTMKLGVMKNQLPASLALADEVFCYTEGLTWDASQVLAPLGAKAHCSGSLPDLVEAIAGSARPGDEVLVMSNGGFGGIHGKLLARLGAA
jgi:UDP-N-acetylmuramate: L-alanyl-gamma-D-glutamyl-meso-diaminopimelate ligase